jgi:hypothetical protein
MKRMILVRGALGLVGVLVFACSSDKSTQTSSRVSKRGESCQTSGDCDTGLVCVRNTCSVGSYNLMPTGKQCVLVSCHEAADCCPTPPVGCPTLLQGCEGGITFECQQYQAQCVCDASKVSCVDGQCQQVCMPPDGITVTFDTCKNMGASFSCVAGKCVECTKDTDCLPTGSTMRVCKDSKCQVKCTKDTDCDPFYKCDTGSAACVYSGCATALECISKTGNPLAVCGADKKCDVPCQSDPECVATVTQTIVGQQPVTAVMSGLQVCASGHCVDVGCDSDDQCRILSHLPGGSKTTAECRAVPGP